MFITERVFGTFFTYLSTHIYAYNWVITRKYKLIEKILLNSNYLYICEGYYFVSYIDDFISISRKFIQQIFLCLRYCLRLYTVRQSIKGL